MAKIGDVVAVDWVDAWYDPDETKPKDWRDDCPVTTYGVLMRKGDIVTVASEVFPGSDGECRSVTHVPAGMVKRIRVLA